MNVKAGYIYYLVSGALFIGMSVWLYFVPPDLFLINKMYSWLFPLFLFLWGIFRIILGYSKYTEKKRNAE